MVIKSPMSACVLNNNNTVSLMNSLIFNYQIGEMILFNWILLSVVTALSFNLFAFHVNIYCSHLRNHDSQMFIFSSFFFPFSPTFIFSCYPPYYRHFNWFPTGGKRIRRSSSLCILIFQHRRTDFLTSQI